MGIGKVMCLRLFFCLMTHCIMLYNKYTVKIFDF